MRDGWRPGYGRGEGGALDTNVRIEDAVVVDVPFAVVIEIPVEPAGRAQADVAVDAAVVVDVQLPVHGRVAAVGELDQHRGVVDRFAAEEARFGLVLAARVGEPAFIEPVFPEARRGQRQGSRGKRYVANVERYPHELAYGRNQTQSVSEHHARDPP